ncbi:MAG TPA: GNAT family N-acetyltransferase [Mycobacteriales bacterium]
MTEAPVFVRLALPREAAAVAAVQARAWGDTYAELLPPLVLARLEPEARAEWAAAIEAPPTSTHHLLVALADGAVTAFAATGPADPDDGGPTAVGALTVLAVDPPRRREGHGSRLLQAVADSLRTDGFTTAICWLPELDTAQLQFLTEAGWGADGATRELDMGAATMTQVRLHTALV